ncbi:TRAP transporter small permease [Oricola thermophila]|uniref:TRAP transporter small permease protein n=1 Tax=Oricola thermophila TaxID=2742145 RepID=A0A6N1VH05_9HYPH|nr:TRAP transporter small permease [Oricola thermophila]QKV20180.1 TRAP transporter small permease subunit [Oricola thermophila]
MGALMKSLSRWLAGLACVALLFILCVTFVDVVGRYVFDAPLTFAVELVHLGMGLLVLFALPLTTIERGHVAVDIADSLLPRSGRRILALIAGICGFLFLSIVAWRLWDRAVNFLGDGLATDILFLPVWPVAFLMAFAAGAAALVAFAQIFAPDAECQDSPPIVNSED